MQKAIILNAKLYTGTGRNVAMTDPMTGKILRFKCKIPRFKYKIHHFYSLGIKLKRKAIRPNSGARSTPNIVSMQAAPIPVIADNPNL